MAKTLKFTDETALQATTMTVTGELRVERTDGEDEGHLYADNITITKDGGIINAKGINATNIITDTISTDSISCSEIFDTDGITAKKANNATYATYLGSSTSYLTYSTLNTVKTKMDGIYNSTGVVKKAQTANTANTANTVNADGTNISIKIISQSDYNSISKDTNTLYLIT